MDPQRYAGPNGNGCPHRLPLLYPSRHIRYRWPLVCLACRPQPVLECSVPPDSSVHLLVGRGAETTSPAHPALHSARALHGCRASCQIPLLLLSSILPVSRFEYLCLKSCIDPSIARGPLFGRVDPPLIYKPLGLISGAGMRFQAHFACCTIPFASSSRLFFVLQHENVGRQLSAVPHATPISCTATHRHRCSSKGFWCDSISSCPLLAYNISLVFLAVPPLLFHAMANTTVAWREAHRVSG
ncbi:hypothetical protein GGR57DRAFT_36918 [Xylariaceae sp. FL1272]|nr:hypothetical protein GGR57DRAFT_36918 [Xylariaceae sp. FL1272]